MSANQPRLPGTGRDGARVARVRRGFDQTVRTLTATGVIDTKADAALIAAGRTLADTIDAEVTSPEPKPGTVGYLVNLLPPIITALRSGREAPTDADPFTAFLADIHTAQVGDTAQP